jgi:hypothetical protein
MASFNQTGQTVEQQNNADVINIGAIASRSELLAQIDAIRRQLNVAAGSGQIDRDKQKLADEYIAEALTEAQKPVPNKLAVRDKIELAKNVVKDVVSVAGLYEALSKAAEVAGRFL